MRRLIGMGATLLVALCVPQMLVAQHGGTLPDGTGVPLDSITPPEVSGPDTTVASALTGQARASYESWPAARRRTYDAWPPEYRAYFWKLNPTQQRIWWGLTNQQKASVFGLNPGQRLAAWQVIEARMAASPPGTPTGSTGR